MLYHMVKFKKSQVLNPLKTLNKVSFCYFQIWIKYKACNTILLMVLCVCVCNRETCQLLTLVENEYCVGKWYSCQLLQSIWKIWLPCL